MALAQLVVARKALAEARTADEFKDIRDQAAAAAYLMQTRGYSLDCQNDAIEIKLRAERGLGELLKETVDHRGGRQAALTNRVLVKDVSYMQSSRWQQAAELPEGVFEEHLVTTRAQGDLLTSEGVRRKAKDRQRAAQRQSNAALVANTAPIKEAIRATFPTIVIDPPWDWDDEGDVDQFGRGAPTYQSLSLQELLDLPVPVMSDPDSHLYLCITNRSLPKGFQLLDKWGFRYVTCVTWCKPSFGMGNYYRGSSEQILFGVKGRLPLLRQDVGTWFLADRPGRRSGKPDELYQMIEQCSPGPWLEMFATLERPGWIAWGAGV